LATKKGETKRAMNDAPLSVNRLRTLPRAARLELLSRLSVFDLQAVCASDRMMRLIACGLGDVKSRRVVTSRRGEPEVTVLRHSLVGSDEVVDDADVLPELWAAFLEHASGISAVAARCQGESQFEKHFVSASVNKFISQRTSYLERLRRLRFLHDTLCDVQLKQPKFLSKFTPQFRECRAGTYVFQSRDYSEDERRPPLLLVSMVQILSRQYNSTNSFDLLPTESLLIARDLIGVEITGLQAALQGGIVMQNGSREFLSVIANDAEPLLLSTSGLEAVFQTALPAGSGNFYERTRSASPNAVMLREYIDGVLTQSVVQFSEEPFHIGFSQKWIVWTPRSYAEPADAFSFRLTDRTSGREGTYRLRAAEQAGAVRSSPIVSFAYLHVRGKLVFALVFTTVFDYMHIVTLTPTASGRVDVKEYRFAQQPYTFRLLYMAQASYLIFEITVARDQNYPMRGFFSFDVGTGKFTSYASSLDVDARVPYLNNFDSIQLSADDEAQQSMRRGASEPVASYSIQ